MRRTNMRGRDIIDYLKKHHLLSRVGYSLAAGLSAFKGKYGWPERLLDRESAFLESRYELGR